MQLSILPNLPETRIPKNKSVFTIENRRFLGNKFKLISFIKSVVDENCDNVKVICDIFAGTGVVGHYLSNNSNKIIFNDLLQSSVVPISAFSTITSYDRERIQFLIKNINQTKTQDDNYFSVNFGNKYFTIDVAKKIGAVREFLETAVITKQEKDILLTSLLYAVDRIANTVGHYDAYRKVLDVGQELELRPLEIPVMQNRGNRVYEEDANRLVRGLGSIDLLYIDPPYNSRQYSDTYHLLENLVRWGKPDVFGKAAKMDRKNLKSRYCLKSAYETFTDLIENASCRYILMSYNNTGDKRDERSNNRISEAEILDVINRKGEVKVFTQAYREFNSGKTAPREDHLETLYFCKVY